jgi:hypothetical protein
LFGLIDELRKLGDPEVVSLLGFLLQRHIQVPAIHTRVENRAAASEFAWQITEVFDETINLL